jgi:hypothetical protein
MPIFSIVDRLGLHIITPILVLQYLTKYSLSTFIYAKLNVKNTGCSIIGATKALPRRIGMGYTRTISHTESVNSGTVILKKTLVLAVNTFKLLSNSYSKHDCRVL